MIHYKQASELSELEQILALQQANLSVAISAEEKQNEGFVTVVHHLPLLNRMNDRCAHIIAVLDNRVIGYALSMHPEFGEEIEVLKPMFRKIAKHHTIRSSYIVMGQICVAKKYRGKGVFRGLYNEMRRFSAPDYRSIITKVDRDNSRSLQAHYAIGFTLISSYRSDGTEWELIILPTA